MERAVFVRQTSGYAFEPSLNSVNIPQCVEAQFLCCQAQRCILYFASNMFPKGLGCLAIKTKHQDFFARQPQVHDTLNNRLHLRVFVAIAFRPSLRRNGALNLLFVPSNGNEGNVACRMGIPFQVGGFAGPLSTRIVNVSCIASAFSRVMKCLIARTEPLGEERSALC